MKNILIAAIAVLSFGVSAANLDVQNTIVQGHQAATYDNTSTTNIKGIGYKMTAVTSASHSGSKDGRTVTVSKEYTNKALVQDQVRHGVRGTSLGSNTTTIITDNLTASNGTFQNTTKDTIKYGTDSLTGSVNTQKVTVSVHGTKPGGMSNLDWGQMVGKTAVAMIKPVNADSDYVTLVGEVRSIPNIASVVGQQGVKIGVSASVDATDTRINQKSNITSGWTTTTTSGTTSSVE